MNELVTVYNKQLVTDSQTVAEHFEKEHKNVLRAIDNLVAQNSATKNMFLEQTREYRGRDFRYYLMNRDGFSLLVMGFTGKAALEWKLKFLEAFNTMEKALREQQACYYQGVADGFRYARWILETLVSAQDEDE
ncbi:Rha family transcriptional regulator [Megasphaera elsdenii]|uniref:Rha family transcriptional regulator n=1 Tax=Megasphaera elsdenii TaxID=907 RepID=UPI003D02205E